MYWKEINCRVFTVTYHQVVKTTLNSEQLCEQMYIRNLD